DGDAKPDEPLKAAKGGRDERGPLIFSYYEKSSANAKGRIKTQGRYRIGLDLKAEEKWVDGQSDLNRCRLTLSIDDKELLSQEFTRQENKSYHFELEQELSKGEHDIVLRVEPLTPDEHQVRTLALRVDAVTFRGPIDDAHRVAPPNYDRFFPR